MAPNWIIWNQLPPTARIVSGSPMSMDSSDSDHSLEITATVNTVNASAPATGPKPTAVANSMAQNRSGSVLRMFMKLRSANQVSLFGVMLRAASTATGMARMPPTTVPMMAMNTVSSMGSARRGRKPKSDGQDSVIRRVPPAMLHRISVSENPMP